MRKLAEACQRFGNFCLKCWLFYFLGRVRSFRNDFGKICRKSTTFWELYVSIEVIFIFSRSALCKVIITLYYFKKTSRGYYSLYELRPGSLFRAQSEVTRYQPPRTAVRWIARSPSEARRGPTPTWSENERTFANSFQHFDNTLTTLNIWYNFIWQIWHHYCTWSWLALFFHFDFSRIDKTNLAIVISIH